MITVAVRTPTHYLTVSRTQRSAHDKSGGRQSCRSRVRRDDGLDAPQPPLPRGSAVGTASDAGRSANSDNGRYASQHRRAFASAGRIVLGSGRWSPVLSRGVVRGEPPGCRSGLSESGVSGARGGAVGSWSFEWRRRRCGCGRSFRIVGAARAISWLRARSRAHRVPRGPSGRPGRCTAGGLRCRRRRCGGRRRRRDGRRRRRRRVRPDEFGSIGSLEEVPRAPARRAAIVVRAWSVSGCPTLGWWASRLRRLRRRRAWTGR